MNSIFVISRPAYELVKDTFDAREDFHPSGELMFFKKTCPWKSHLFKIESQTGNEGLIKFVFFQDGNGMYRVQAVPGGKTGFSNRIGLHHDWKGLREDQLKEVTGLKSVRFVHHGAFIGGADDLEDVIQMAVLSMEAHYEEQKQEIEEKQE